MNKNVYVNTLTSYHSSLCPKHEHEHYRGSVLAVAHFCQQSGMPLEEAKERVKKMVEERRKIEQ